MTQTFPRTEPPQSVSDVSELALAHLDFYRGLVLFKVGGMPESDLRRSMLPSGWTPLELVRHLTYVERRWLRWGFAGEDIDEPWGDQDASSGRWGVPAGLSVTDVLREFDEEVGANRVLLEQHSLGDRAQAGDRFDDPDRPPTLGWIIFHLIQEYARHVGHLDIARELADGAIGEAPDDPALEPGNAPSIGQTQVDAGESSAVSAGGTDGDAADRPR